MEEYALLLRKTEELKRAAANGAFEIAPDRNLAIAGWAFKASYGFAKSAWTQWLVGLACLFAGLYCCYMAVQLDEALMPVRSSASNPWWGPGILLVFISIATSMWRLIVWVMAAQNAGYINEAHAEYLRQKPKVS